MVLEKCFDQKESPEHLVRMDVSTKSGVGSSGEIMRPFEEEENSDALCVAKNIHWAFFLFRSVRTSRKTRERAKTIMNVTLFAPPPHGSIRRLHRRPLASPSFPSRVPSGALSSNARSISLRLCSTSTPPPSTLQLEEEAGEEENAADVTFDPDAAETDSAASPRGCEACGREKIESGCNGEGRIQGGIATVPGFGWWPIKAYRPCPGFVESGGRYRRRGQSMDEVVSGRSGKAASAFASEASEKRQGPGRLKR